MKSGLGPSGSTGGVGASGGGLGALGLGVPPGGGVAPLRHLPLRQNSPQKRSV